MAEKSQLKASKDAKTFSSFCLASGSSTAEEHAPLELKLERSWA